jgi:phage-related protein
MSVKRWELKEYPTVLSEFLLTIVTDKALRAETMTALQLLREKGNALGMPISESLRDGILQLRPHTHTRQARLLYYFGKDERKAVFVYCFIKKTQETPNDVIDLAKSRRTELEKAEKKDIKKKHKRRSNGH